MTMTASNQKIKKSLMTEAIQRAKLKGENVAICVANFNGDKRQCLALVSEYEKSPNKESIEILTIVDADGRIVD